MDKDRIEGKIEDIKGRVKRQVGEWTGDKDEQAEGTLEQAKGKIQNAWGNLKDAGRDILDRNAEPKAAEGNSDRVVNSDAQDVDEDDESAA